MLHMTLKREDRQAEVFHLCLHVEKARMPQNCEDPGLGLVPEWWDWAAAWDRAASRATKGQTQSHDSFCFIIFIY